MPARIVVLVEEGGVQKVFAPKGLNLLVEVFNADDNGDGLKWHNGNEVDPEKWFDDYNEAVAGLVEVY